MENQSERVGLPDHWKLKKLGEIISRSKEKVDPIEIDPVAYVGLEHIEKGLGRITEPSISSEVKSAKSTFHEGDVLYGKLRPYLNKVWLASFSGVCSTDLLVLRTSSDIISRYIHYRLLASDFVRFADSRSSGVNHPRVSFKKISKFSIGVPPLPEQRRIVDKIEELFSNLDAGVESLKTARRQVDRYRQSVLQAAVEGRLTADWRQSHDPEPAEELLERILEERRAQWEKQYLWERYESKGKDAPSGWKARYKDPKAPAKEEGLPKLPEGWIWTSLDALTWNNIDYRGKTPPYSESGILTISAGNIKDGVVTFETQRKVCQRGNV